jgi:two-component sensor histidine kinase
MRRKINVIFSISLFLLLVTFPIFSQNDTIAFKRYFMASRQNLHTDLDSSSFYLQKAREAISGVEYPLFTVQAMQLENSILYKIGDQKNAERVLREALQLCEKHQLKKQKALILRLIGIDHKNNREHDTARNYFNEALEIAEELQDSLLTGVLIFSLATLYQENLEFQKAIEYYNKSIDIELALGREKEISGIYSNLAMIYEDLNDFDKALKYHLKAIEIDEEYENYGDLALSFINIGGLLTTNQQSEQAIMYFMKADSLLRAIKFEVKHYFFSIHSGLLVNYLNLKKYNDATQIGLKMLNNDPPNHVKIYTLRALAKIKAEQNDCTSALSYIKALDDTDFDELFEHELLKYHETLADVYELCNNYKKAYEHLAIAYDLRDSLFVESDRKNAKEADEKYQSGIKEQMNQKLTLENELQVARLTSQSAYLKAGSFFLLVLGLMSMFLYRLNLKRKKLNEELAESNSKIMLLHREALHRNQNQLALAASLIAMQKNQIAEKSPEEIIRESESKLRAIASVNKRLSDEDRDKVVNIREVIEEIISGNIFSLALRDIKLRMNVDEIQLKPDLITALSLLTNELSVNSIKHAFADTEAPEITLDIHQNKSSITYKYYDNGIVKDTGRKGIGSQLIIGLIDQLHGRYELSASPNYALSIEIPTNS